jgi:diketogulonate reductase-like aldo/keto reductase
MTSTSASVVLPSGHKMPLLGFGTYRFTSNVHDMKVALNAAFDSGYRLVDTAYSYTNEPMIGEALKEIFDSGKLKREELFVTTKIQGMFTGSREKVRECIQKSLSDLKLDYVDLYLIHWPAGLKHSEPTVFVPKGNSEFEHHDHVQTWKWMEELVDEGLVRSIGLSNFNSKQIATVQAAARIPISNLQVECHVYLTQVKLHQFCQQLGITFTSYCTLGGAGYGTSMVQSVPAIIEDPVVVGIANKHSKTPAQVLLRFMIERNIAVIPKSTSPSRIRENSQIFDFKLSSEEMNQLHQLNKNHRLFREVIEKWYGEHPDYPWHEEF